MTKRQNLLQILISGYVGVIGLIIFDFRIIADCGKGHVRVSFFPDEIIISDLFVRVDKRGERYGTALLDYADELVQKFGEGKQASISALTGWEREWYIRRGYKIIDE